MPTKKKIVTKEPLARENGRLRRRLEELEATLDAIRRGEVDALVVSGAQGKKVQVLGEADHPYRILAQSMQDGAATLIEDGTIFFVNPRFAEMVGRPEKEIVGSSFPSFFSPVERGRIQQGIQLEAGNDAAGEYELLSAQGPRYVRISFLPMEMEQTRAVMVIVTDVTEEKRAVEALRKSEQRYRFATRATSDVIWEWDLDTNLFHWTENAEIVLGYSLREIELNIEWWQERIHPEDRQRVLAGLTAAFEGEGSFWQEEYRFRRMDGSYAIVSDRGHIERDENGRAVRMIGALSDITGRLRAEQALRSAERRFRSLVENSSEEISIVSAEGELLYESPSNSPTLGYRAGEFLGQNIFQIMHPEDQERIQQLFERLIREPHMSIRDQFRLKHHDGSWRWVEAVGTNLLADPNVGGIVVNYHDITGRKQAELELQESEARYRDLVENSQDLICTHTLDGTLLSINAAAAHLLDYEPNQILQKNIRDFLAPESLARFDLYLRRIARIGKASGEMVVVTRQGEERVWVFNNSLRTEGVPEPVVRGMAHDITERKQAEEKLAKSEERFRLTTELISDFAYSIRVMPDGSPKGEWITPTFSKVFGYTLEDLGKIGGMFNIVHPADVDLVRAHYQRVLSGNADVAEMRFMTRRGEARWVLDYARPVWDSHHEKVIRIYGASQDTTERKQAEEALIQSETQFRSLFDDSPIALWVEDFSEIKTRFDRLKDQGIEDIPTYLQAHPEFVRECARHVKILDVNNAAVKLYKAAAKNELLTSLSQIFPAVTESQFADELTLIAQEQLQFELDRFDQTLTGEEIEVSMRWSVAPGYEHNLKRVIVSTMDITERRKALNALKESEERFSNAFEHAPIGMALVAPDGRILKANRSLCEMLGYSEEEIIGLTYQAITHPDDLEADLAYANELISGQISSYQMEKRYIHKDGHLVWGFLSVSIARNDQSTPLYFISQVSNITERKQAEEQIKFQADMLSAVGSAVVATDLNGRILYWNTAAERMYGWSASEAMGGNVIDTLPAPGAKKQAAKIMKLVQDGVLWNGEFEMQRRDGGSFPVFLSITPFLNPAGKQVGTIGIANDITDIKQVEQELYQKVTALQSVSEIQKEISAAQQADRVLDLVCRRVAELIQVPKVTVFLSGESNLLRMVATFGVSDPSAAQREFFAQLNQGFFNEASGYGQKFFISELPEDFPFMPEFFRRENVHAFAASPLVSNEKANGILVVFDTKPRTWTKDELQMLDLLAGQAAIATDKIRLFDRERSQRAELSILYQLSSQLGRSNDFEEVMHVAAADAVELLHVSFARVVLFEEHEFAVRAGSPARNLESPPVSSRQTSQALPTCMKLLNEKQPVLLHSTDQGIGAAEMEFLGLNVARSLCLAPMQIGNKPLGFLVLGVTDGDAQEPFGEDKLRLVASIAGLAANAINRTQLFHETEGRLHQLQALNTIDQAISNLFDLKLVLNILIRQAQDRLGIDAVAVQLFDPITQKLKYVTGAGLHTREIERYQQRVGEGLVGHAALHRQTLIVPNVQVDARLERRPFITAEGIVSYCGVPLIAKGKLLGVLETFHRTPFKFGQDWVDFCQTLAGQAAIAIENAQLFEGLQKTNLELYLAYDATIEGWSKAMDLRDRETEGHTQRVTKLTMELAQAMKMGEADLVHIRRGALLHDIGKMGIPDRILLKPGKLDEHEWEIMKQHPTLAYELLHPIEYLRPALDIPYCHHEKWDGSGYPRGLRKEQIPLAARLFAVVDVWDALTSDRPYRPAWTQEQTLEYIRQQSGTHFDPKAVEAFMNLISSGALLK